MLLPLSSRRRSTSSLFWFSLLCCSAFSPECGQGQDTPAKAADGATNLPFVVSDESLSIDAATLVPAKLRQSAEATFTEASLSEVARWLQAQTGLNVSLDQRSLAAAGVDENSPVSDSLQNQPLYLLLDRLARLNIGWRLDGEVLRLHGLGDSAMLHNQQYNVGDLLDQKFDAAELEETILSAVEPEGGWSVRSEKGEGDLIFLGDVLFIRQDERTHRRIAGLLAALRAPSRRVLVDDPAEHAALRTALDRQLTVQFKARPLGAAVAELAEQSGIDLRLDAASLKSTKVTERTPVTFELQEQSLQTTLDLLLGQLGLSSILRDGVLWVTPREEADRFLKTAVFDVRDICPNVPASGALREALQQQVDSGSWGDEFGQGEIVFAKPGVMVIRQSERRLDAVEELLGNYRMALKNSKRRISEDEDPEVVVTRYYLMPVEVAAEMEKVLPELVAPDSWKSDLRPEAVGSIRQVRSWAEAKTVGSQLVLVPQATLIVSQKRKIHQEINEFLDRVRHGASMSSGGGMGGMGGMGGKLPASGGIF